MLVSIPFYLLSICDNEKWQLEICSKSKSQSIMVLQGSWLITHSVSLVLSCLDGVTSPLLQFHHRMGWNRWGRSGQPCPVFVEAPVSVCTAREGRLGKYPQQDLPGEICRCLCPWHQCLICAEATGSVWHQHLCHWLLVLPHWGCPGSRRAVPPPHCEKAKKPTPNYRMSAMISSPQPLFFSMGWVGFLPLEGCDLSCSIVFQGKSPLDLQAVFTGSTTYLGIFVSIYKYLGMLGRAWHAPHRWHQTGLWQRNLYGFLRNKYSTRTGVIKMRADGTNRVSEKQG